MQITAKNNLYKLAKTAKRMLFAPKRQFEREAVRAARIKWLKGEQSAKNIVKMGFIAHSESPFWAAIDF